MAQIRPRLRRYYMSEPKKRKYTFVVYTPGGEHIMIECDDLKANPERITMYNIEKDEEGKEQEDMIAMFFIKNIVGWEQVR